MLMCTALSKYHSVRSHAYFIGEKQPFIRVPHRRPRATFTIQTHSRNPSRSFEITEQMAKLLPPRCHPKFCLPARRYQNLPRRRLVFFAHTSTVLQAT